MKYFISDTHFFHTNIIKYSKRPFKNIPHMNYTMVNNWNSMVTPDDTVYHLGDIALGDWEQWDGLMQQLNGHKIMLVGNHDWLFRENSVRRKTEFLPRYQQWFEEIHTSLDLVLEDESSIVMSHFPYESDHTGTPRFMSDRVTDEGKTLVHGHTHSKQKVSYSKKGTLQIHVGVDAWNFMPVSETQIIDLIIENG